MKVTNIAKNTSYFTIALVIQKILSFTYFTILANYLIPEDLGKYYLAISFTSIFAIFIDFGLSNVLTREVAKNQERSGSLLGVIMAFKLPLAVLAISATALMVNVLGYPSLTRTLVYLSSISMVLDSFTMSFFSVIRGFHNLKYESISSIMFMVIALGWGIVALRLELSLPWIIMALVASSIFNLLYSLGFLLFKFKISFRPRWDKVLMKSIILIALPFAMYGIFQRIYMYLDTVLLSIMAGDRAVGIYQIAFKIIFALQFLPMAFIASLYPAFSSYWQHNREQLAITFERAMNYLIIISLPISLGISVLARSIINLFKPEYSDAVLPLQIIIGSLIFIFLNFPVGSLLNACDRQKRNTLNMSITVTVSIILNLILIPRLQATGASITVFATNFLMLALGLQSVSRVVKIRYGKILSVLFRSLPAAILMAGAVYFLKSLTTIFVAVPIGGLLYFCILYLFGGFRRDDVASILNAFIGKKKAV